MRRLTMDEEVNPGEENANAVLAQESSEMLTVLSNQSSTVIIKLYEMIPGEARRNIGHPNSSTEAYTECIKAMLEYFKSASVADCCSFLQSMCILCENIPMHLESRLMSVAGYANNICEESSSSVSENKLSPQTEWQPIKRPRIDHWRKCLAATMNLLQRRWERLSEHVVREVTLENVWVGPRMATRGRDRPDQTPGTTDRRGRTPEPDGDYYGSAESKVTLETFLQGCTGKVTVLVGPSGSGKTLLMSHLGQQWAHGLGPIPSCFLFVLLEFRHLNLVSRPLSLSELLFQLYLSPKWDANERRAIVDYLLCNPEQSCWVLDGYDEFHCKLTKQEVQGMPLDPEKPLPVEHLISALLNRQLLPGSTLVVTCRARDVTDFEGVADKVGQLLEWDNHCIKDYVHSYFEVTGKMYHRNVGLQAADILLSTQHLLAMSSIPALCRICCICLEHFLLHRKDTESSQTLEGRKAAKEKETQMTEEFKVQTSSKEQNHTGLNKQGEGTRMSEDKAMDGTIGGSQLTSAQTQIASTLTQVYLAAVVAFLCRDSHDGRAKDTSISMIPQQSIVHTLGQYRAELSELCQLAWKGLEEGRILFMDEDISQDVLKFSLRTGLFSQAELRREDGTVVNSYCFIHLTVQEFLAALRIMTSHDVSDTQLKKRFSLKTRWMTKTDQRTVFTDSLILYVCGLASSHCTTSLVELAKASDGTGARIWVQKRQALVLKLLKNLCHSNTLTGPKILELCHCVQESQDHQLAREVVGVRPILELRNIRLLPNDIDALAFVVNSVGDNGIGLDFGACSMELECLDVLPRCQYIQHLCFRSRKYGDKFAEKLSSILPVFTKLRKLEFCGASLTATGAACLVSALQSCPEITDINLIDNNLKDAGIEHIADILPKLPRLDSIMLGRNNTSLSAVDYIIRKISSCLNIQHIHADGLKELTVSLSSDLNTQKTRSKPTVSLLNQKWTIAEMNKVGESLTRCPGLYVLDLSGGQWNEEILSTLTQFLPKLNITGKIILNDSCSSVEGLVILTALLSNCPAVKELHIRLQSLSKVEIVFAGGREKHVEEGSKILCLSCCDLKPTHLDSIWKNLGTSSDITSLDLSDNHLGNKGLKKLLEILPHLSGIQEINASNNGVSVEGVMILAGAMCSHDNLTEIQISQDGKQQLSMKFCPNTRYNGEPLSCCRMNQSILLQANITKLCRRLVPCRSPLELDFSRSSLNEEAIKNLLKVLPKMATLQRLNVSHSITSTAEALMFISCLNVSERVTSVELRSKTESSIHFDSRIAEHASCRLTHFNLDIAHLDRLLESLQQGPQLSYLDLSNNRLDDEGVKRLLDILPELEITSWVNLSSNGLTQQGLLDVVSTLCSAANISHVEVSVGADKTQQRCLIWFAQHEGCEKALSIRESSLGRDHLVRLAEMVSISPSLNKLELQHNFLQSAWIEDFVKLLSSSSSSSFTVSFEESWMISEKAVHLMCRCLELNSNIHSIKVHSNTLHLSLSAGPTALTSVSLMDCAVEGQQLEPMMSVIQRCPLLAELKEGIIFIIHFFSHNSLDLETADFLGSVLPFLPNLTSLSIGSKKTCVNMMLSEVLLQVTAVQRLSLSGLVVEEAAADVMSQMLPHLQSLKLTHCMWPVAAGQHIIRALGGCISLEGLCLESVQLDEESMEVLAHSLRTISSIRSLKFNEIAKAVGQLGASNVPDFLAAMEGLTKMEEIELNGWRMADSGVEQLTRLLPVWTELRKISLCKNLISDQAGNRLLEALQSCRHLEELHVSSNILGDLTAARMELVLPTLTHITVLDISENRIGSEGLLSLSKAIIHMKNLTKIHLTSVGTSELCSVVASLAHCPLIQDVGLGWNNCGDKVAEEMAKVMLLCPKLTRIDLESNSVSVCGAESLLRALQSCPSLQVIRLWRNQVTARDAQRLSLEDGRLNFSST
ncbi:uncharacterized protein V6R79_007331 [Siganus canaliculatus]